VENYSVYQRKKRNKQIIGLSLVMLVFFLKKNLKVNTSGINLLLVNRFNVNVSQLSEIRIGIIYIIFKIIIFINRG